ncbi:hypothetical protein M404DRAFT_149811 [Pisolithus tinctorius Marx 270]|uniref:Uncharacterized protein n=1 Tax=Pisolithus tinctorius Marx 270 TaxID=870435 RepID=A0A0C3IXM0_PISTI|nr:hypothetical protein M404DRAFT_149811 [Pisolithus tinctorius Marx 270]
MLLFIVCFREDHQVVDIDHEDILHVTEDVIHHVLEGRQRVAETEVHDYDKGSLPLVSFLHVNIVVSPSEIHLSEELTPLELIDELGDKRERVCILDCMFVEVTVSHTKGVVDMVTADSA